MQEKILELLRQADGYVSGQELCEQLGVSRTAVWKVMKQLKESGYVIDSVPNRGYCLLKSPDILKKEDIGAGLTTDWLGRRLYCLETTDSTNLQVKRLAEEGAEAGTTVTAQEQSAGRGSRGRGWDSPKGTGIFMSVLLRPPLEPAQASMLTLVTAWSTAGALREVCGADIRIKWPNDLVLNRKKLVGILTEMSCEEGYIHYIVTGIGINVNQTEFPQELSDKATSLRLETGQCFRRAELITAVLNRLEKNYEQFLEEQNLGFLMEDYNALLISRGEEVRILRSGRERTGRALGINEQGELLVEHPDGTTEAVASGEVSVRGLYQYV